MPSSQLFGHEETTAFVRFAFHHAQNGLCIYCEQTTKHHETVCIKQHNTDLITFDHIRPKSQFPKRRYIHNLIGACDTCNRKKSDKGFEKFFNARKLLVSKTRAPIFTMGSIPKIQDKVAWMYVANRAITEVGNLVAISRNIIDKSYLETIFDLEHVRMSRCGFFVLLSKEVVLEKLRSTQYEDRLQHIEASRDQVAA